MHQEVPKKPLQTWQKDDKLSDFQGGCRFASFDPSNCGAEVFFLRAPRERNSTGVAGHP